MILVSACFSASYTLEAMLASKAFREQADAYFSTAHVQIGSRQAGNTGLGIGEQLPKKHCTASTAQTEPTVSDTQVMHNKDEHSSLVCNPALTLVQGWNTHQWC